MRFSFFSSIRAILVFLVLLAMLPALGIMLCSGYSLREHMIVDAEEAALRQIHGMASHHEQVVENARLLLATLAKAHEIQTLDPLGSQLLLEEMLTRNEAYVALVLSDPAGRIVAVSPVDSFSSIAGEVYFQDAKQGMRFVTGMYHLRQGVRSVVMEFAQPVMDREGGLRGVLVALFDLNYFGRIFAAAHLPEGSVFTLTDAEGIRLTRFPETEKYTWVPDLPYMIEKMSAGADQGTFLDKGVDGVRRLYGFKRVQFEDAHSPPLMIRLGQPEDLALAEARRALVRDMVLLVLAAVLAVATAWFVGNLTIMRRLERLMAAADRLGTGDLSTRTMLDHDKGELGVLAAAFDRMAESLQIQDFDRRRAEHECCQLNTELEERVASRTAELAKANKELQTALGNLRQAQGQLVMSEKLAALGGLVAGVAHEINTPVGVALSASSTMAEKNRILNALFTKGEMKRSDLTEYLESTREGLEMSLLNLNRASDLIRSFKMVAADQVSESRRSFNVREYIGQVLLSLRPKLKKTPHRVEVECDEDLVIESYPGALSQILTNFIVNSLTHAFGEGQAGLIRIAVAKNDGTLSLTYSDDGCGIAPEVQDRIFEPFYTTARAKGSTGLGLHIVFNIVTVTLGGTVTCCSALGQGTTFQVRVPV
ncbi:ATP-binding protein [Desulfomicrobium sp. ZS1]|uniref:sensor histidine kinase n=1 Tax=Desulfomicrobium sp. ZS1 TaxID=2952228 RepID=UPI0020B33BDC|nr:ATP-binding protein [Desulfomicrobium sp. ZS1]UTF49260.1 ATP-binding protein [Desulfomicrobium sp. ZS1]